MHVNIVIQNEATDAESIAPFFIDPSQQRNLRSPFGASPIAVVVGLTVADTGADKSITCGLIECNYKTELLHAGKRKTKIIQHSENVQIWITSL